MELDQVKLRLTKTSRGKTRQKGLQKQQRSNVIASLRLLLFLALIFIRENSEETPFFLCGNKSFMIFWLRTKCPNNSSTFTRTCRCAAGKIYSLDISDAENGVVQIVIIPLKILPKITSFDAMHVAARCHVQIKCICNYITLLWLLRIYHSLKVSLLKNFRKILHFKTAVEPV